jgi:hypothetical protein
MIESGGIMNFRTFVFEGIYEIFLMFISASNA